VEHILMPGDFFEAKPRDFNPMSVSGLTNEARDGVNAALEAVSTWRNEIAATNEKNGKRVMDKMAAAALALGWPEQVVDAARTQLQSIADMQIKTVDQLLDAWEQQIKLPNPMTASPSGMLSKLQSLPGLTPTGSRPTTPLELWMQLAEQCQRAWADTMGLSGKRP
jgi:ribonuclease D